MVTCGSWMHWDGMRNEEGVLAYYYYWFRNIGVFVDWGRGTWGCGYSFESEPDLRLIFRTFGYKLLISSNDTSRNCDIQLRPPKLRKTREFEPVQRKGVKITNEVSEVARATEKSSERPTISTFSEVPFLCVLVNKFRWRALPPNISIGGLAELKVELFPTIRNLADVNGLRLPIGGLNSTTFPRLPAPLSTRPPRNVKYRISPRN
jgi:hypothetical protein